MTQASTLSVANNRIQELTDENAKLKEHIKATMIEQCPTLVAANMRTHSLTNENKKLKELIKNTIWYVKTNSHISNIRELVLNMLETSETKVDK